MRARFHVALCTLVLPYRTGDVIYLTQAGTDTNRHTQINTHTHTHTHTFTPSSKQHRLGHVKGTVKVFASYHCDLMNFSIFGVFQYVVSLLFSAQNGHLWPVGISSDCLPSPLWWNLCHLFSVVAFWYDKMFQVCLVFTGIFLITKYLTELDVLLCFPV